MKETEFILEAKDCVEAMQALPAESVDVVVTSPPYNLGIRYGTYQDERDQEEYLGWCEQWADEVKRVLKLTGSFFLNVGASPSDPLLPHEIVLRMCKLFTLQNTFHWIKSITIETKQGDRISAGHFKPINSKRFVNDCHEFVFHLTRLGVTPLDRLGLGVPYEDKSNIARWGHTNGKDVRCRGNNWFIPYKTILNRSRQRPHPATFPTELAVNCLKIHGLRPDLVMLDPFVGIGHAAMAARQCGIARFIGFDIDPEYIEVARSAAQNGTVSSAPASATARAPASGSTSLPAKRKRGRPKKVRPGSADAQIDFGLET